ncbi:hypothetical protein L210DRAFT_3044991 [Boletus edulis BED1]|uniref:CCHC-type domain-containing protein n=1 Tax=Boletus edulis BED1 TaxID=1328754 RepID=A0AAD4GHV5_BOLED|nr:hypothetical protein L210DRAFT_3044991 [Boletus edulis BED1]
MPNRSTSHGASRLNNASATCFKCGEAGHFSNACPGVASHPASRATGTKKRTGGDSSSDECFKCGQTGHWVTDCPGDGAPSKRPKSSSSRGGKAPRARGGSTRGTGTKRGAKKNATLSSVISFPFCTFYMNRHGTALPMLNISDG